MNIFSEGTCTDSEQMRSCHYVHLLLYEFVLTRENCVCFRLCYLLPKALHSPN